MTLAQNPLTDRLDELRGAAPTSRHNARTIAALTANPGCARRALLDAAAVDKTVIARELGFPPQFGQSPFAITRGNSFEAMVKSHGCAELLRLLREELGLSIPEVGYHDLATVGDNATNSIRYQRTKQLLGQALSSGQGTLFDHPMLRLEIAGATAYLEPDVVALQIGGKYHVVEIKSFAIVDGQADPAQVASAARQSAVYVLAMRELLRELGYSSKEIAEKLSDESILVAAKDFTNRPVAAKLDLRKQLAVIGRQLSRLTSIHSLLDLVPAGASFTPGEGLSDTVSAIPSRYAPECMSSCELAFACRAEARANGSVDTLGRGVCDDLGGIDNLDTVLALAEGTLEPGPEHADIAEMLRQAQALRLEVAG